MFTRSIIAGWLAMAALGASYLQSASQEPSPAPPGTSANSALINRYCVTCHNEKLKTAGLMLDKMDADHIGEGAPIWEKVVRKLRAGQMPPSGMPRPDKPTYDAFANYLETELDRAALASPNPGRVSAFHRLNRAEYTNAIRDLLAIDTNAIDLPSLLPSDDSGGGFDNIADVLSVSPVLMEKYLSAARKIGRLAIGDPTLRPDSMTYELSEYLKQDDRMSEDLPFGTHGGMAVRHHFPLDGEYVLRVRLQRNENLYVRGIAEPHPIDIRLDGARIKMLTIGGEHKGKAEGTGAMDSVDPDHNESQYERTADTPLEIRFPVKAGSRLVAVTLPNEFLAAENQRGEADIAVSSVTIAGPYNAKGSGDTESRRRIFICQPAETEPPFDSAQGRELVERRPKGSGPSGKDHEETCAKRILSTLARRAYRRPVTDVDSQELLGLYREGRKEGGFEAGILMGLRRILISPEFLFRIERDPASATPNSTYRISDIEMASRLSFFLWSSIPDDELLELAERGKLKDPAELEKQVRRMLADARSKALVDNFGGQWLYLRNMRTAHPSKDVFPDFDENLREAFQKETELFFESMLREDRSVLDLLRADYTFVNERLARHYGIANVYGNRFRRVTLTDENRRGLLGQGSILTVTSIANRTSPVLRGKWVLENLLGTPPPEPPPNVPPLKEKAEGGKDLTMRQQMEAHRANAVCASCHRMMDPIGFALDNFDAIGQWRTAEGKAPIDPSGVLPDGTQFQGIAELKKILISRPNQIVHTVTEKLLMYALGRGVEYYDQPTIRTIMRQAAPSDYRWSSLIIGIVKSMPFQMRRSRES